MPVHARHIACRNLLFDATQSCNWNCCQREQRRRDLLSHRSSPTNCSSRIPLGCSSHGIYHVRYSGNRTCLAQTTIATSPIRSYTTFVIGLALGFTAFFIPFFYAESYALNIGVDSELSFYILSIMNAGGMIGRMLPNAIADKYAYISHPSG